MRKEGYEDDDRDRDAEHEEEDGAHMGILFGRAELEGDDVIALASADGGSDAGAEGSDEESEEEPEQRMGQSFASGLGGLGGVVEGLVYALAGRRGIEAGSCGDDLG